MKDILFIAGGLSFLYFGGDLLISGCVRVARHFRLPHFIIGATIMGFGTSTPELCVSMLAAINGSPAMSVGNVLGSNVANIGLVLGLTALWAPMTIEKSRLRRETPPLLLASALLLWVAWDLHISRWEGFIMAAGIILYVGRALVRREDPHPDTEAAEEGYFPQAGFRVQFLLIGLGLVGLVLGAQWMVTGSVNLARAFGISEWLIGITIVAVGTSLPEIVSSTLSAIRGHGEMALGNVFGSNIFNILMVLGSTALVQPLKIEEPIQPDLLYLGGFTVLLLFLIRWEHTLSKRDGAVLLAGYGCYIGLKIGGWL
ncbi:MAG: calcium/sodium antiporter [Nitrospinaceae bacterium]